MSKVKEKVTPYAAADYLKTDQDIVGYLDAALEDEDPRVFALAMGDALRARNVSQVAREVGVTREGLYKAFSAEGNPSLSTVAKVARALGLRLAIIPAGLATLPDVRTARDLKRDIPKAAHDIRSALYRVPSSGNGVVGRAKKPGYDALRRVTSTASAVLRGSAHPSALGKRVAGSALKQKTSGRKKY